MPVARTPEARFDGLPDYPFAPHWLEVDGLRVHYVDEGRGAPCCSCTASRPGPSSVTGEIRMTINKPVRLSKKGQFVIPKEMREALGVKEGDELLVTLSWRRGQIPCGSG